ncbi:hypothetical protein [Wenyingzhuangia sp. IMCC45574]
MNSKMFLLIVFLAVYIFFTVRALKRLRSNTILSLMQKNIHSVLICLIPFAWYFLISEQINYDSETMTKKKRDKMRKNKRGHANERGVGIGIIYTDNDHSSF